MRGNHDTFDVEGQESRSNFFNRFSVQGRERHPRSYADSLQVRGMTINYIGIDMTPVPGFKQPYNFMGYFTQKEEEKVTSLVKNLGPSDLNVFFGHYPTSFVGGPGGSGPGSLRDLMKDHVYLCGHLHTLFR